MLAETVVEIQFQEFWEYTIKPYTFTANGQLLFGIGLGLLLLFVGPNF